MADDAHEVCACAAVVDGVAHRFAVQGQRAVLRGELGIPGTQRALEVLRIDAHQHIADDPEAGH